LDLPYVEDSRAETDMNVVMTGSGKFVEVQGTAEVAPFDRDELGRLLDLAGLFCAELTRIQSEVLAGCRPSSWPLTTRARSVSCWPSLARSSAPRPLCSPQRKRDFAMSPRPE